MRFVTQSGASSDSVSLAIRKGSMNLATDSAVLRRAKREKLVSTKYSMGQFLDVVVPSVKKDVYFENTKCHISKYIGCTMLLEATNSRQVKEWFPVVKPWAKYLKFGKELLASPIMPQNRTV